MIAKLIPYSNEYAHFLNKCVPTRYIKRYMNRGIYHAMSILQIYHSDFFLYKVGSNIVGCILIRSKIDKCLHKTYWIYSVLIFPEYRGKGYSKELMRLAIEKISSSTVFLYVNKANEVAINLYLQIGFKEVDTHGEEILMRYDKI